MDLHRGIEQQVLDRGVRSLLHDQAGPRRHQHGVGRRTVPGEVGDAGRQRHLAEIREQRDVSIGVPEARKLDAFVRQEPLDHRRIPGSSIIAASISPLSSFSSAACGVSESSSADLPIGAAALEQVEREHARAAAFGPDRNLAALQAVDVERTQRRCDRTAIAAHRTACRATRSVGVALAVAVPLCTSATLTPECGLRSSARFSTAPPVGRSCRSTPARARMVR